MIFLIKAFYCRSSWFFSSTTLKLISSEYTCNTTHYSTNYRASHCANWTSYAGTNRSTSFWTNVWPNSLPYSFCMFHIPQNFLKIFDCFFNTLLLLGIAFSLTAFFQFIDGILYLIDSLACVTFNAYTIVERGNCTEYRFWYTNYS